MRLVILGYGERGNVDDLFYDVKKVLQLEF